MIQSKYIQTPFGTLLAAATEKGICLLEFTDTERLSWQLPRLEKDFATNVKPRESVFFTPLEEQLHAYFSGELQAFDLPLDFKGSDFQILAWQALLEIPYAETRSYQEQATAINKPKAFRAVASANRNNRISIIIPCHRVIAKNGSLAGYGGGLERKEYLLKLERKYRY